MDPDTAHTLRQLLQHRGVGALGTLHRGDPAVSMVPYVVAADGLQLFIHVSALATHTADLQRHRRVGLMVMAEMQPDTPAQALPRVSLQADADVLPRDGADYTAAKAAYLQRFADAAVTFELGDFAMVALRPVSARLVAGFGRAHSLVGDQLRHWLADKP